ncbi:MAG: hypothetical protein P8X79_05335 [Reinekea sp.]
MLPQNWGEPMGVPAIFEKQIEIKLLPLFSRANFIFLTILVRNTVPLPRGEIGRCEKFQDDND